MEGNEFILISLLPLILILPFSVTSQKNGKYIPNVQYLYADVITDCLHLSQ